MPDGRRPAVITSLHSRICDQAYQWTMPPCPPPRGEIKQQWTPTKLWGREPVQENCEPAPIRSEETMCWRLNRCARRSLRSDRMPGDTFVSLAAGVGIAVTTKARGWRKRRIERGPSICPSLPAIPPSQMAPSNMARGGFACEALTETEHSPGIRMSQSQHSAAIMSALAGAALRDTHFPSRDRYLPTTE